MRLDENPLPRWPEGRALAEDLGRWWVARVKPRNEKALALELGSLGVGYYLPMLIQRTQRKDNGKTRKSVVCMFPGYVPLVGYPERGLEIMRSHRVIGIIAIPDQAQFVRELDSVRMALGGLGPVDIHPQLVAGRRVRIIAGPMLGAEGVILDMTRRNLLYLNVEAFQRSIVVRVSPEQVLLADAP